MCLAQAVRSVLIPLWKNYGSRGPLPEFADSLINIFKHSSGRPSDFLKIVKEFSSLLIKLSSDPGKAVKIERAKRAPDVFLRTIADIFLKIFKEKIIESDPAFDGIADDDPSKMFVNDFFAIIPNLISHEEATSDDIKSFASIIIALVEHSGMDDDYQILMIKNLFVNFFKVMNGELSSATYVNNLINTFLRLVLKNNPLLGQLLLKDQTDLEEIGQEVQHRWFPLLKRGEQFLNRIRSGDQEIPDSLTPLFQYAAPCVLDIVLDVFNQVLASYSGPQHSSQATVEYDNVQGASRGLWYHQYSGTA